MRLAISSCSEEKEKKEKLDLLRQLLGCIIRNSYLTFKHLAETGIMVPAFSEKETASHSGNLCQDHMARSGKQESKSCLLTLPRSLSTPRKGDS